ncbi:MAG TPA: hypothetical protein VFV57_02245, partial [Limnobacter sp.]|nr:hypothetical protein [Limnobacter sp.]
DHQQLTARIHQIQQSIDDRSESQRKLTNAKARHVDNLQSKNPQLAEFEQQIDQTTWRIHTKQQQLNNIALNWDDLSKNHLANLAPHQKTIEDNKAIIASVRANHGKAIEQMVERITDATALKRLYERHTLIADRQLNARVHDGLFTNAIGQRIQSPANTASSFDGLHALQYALLCCHEDAKSKNTMVGENIALTLPTAVGKVTEGASVRPSKQVRYSYRNSWDPQTRENVCLITHLVCD